MRSSSPRIGRGFAPSPALTNRNKKELFSLTAPGPTIFRPFPYDVASLPQSIAMADLPESKSNKRSRTEEDGVYSCSRASNSTDNSQTPHPTMTWDRSSPLRKLPRRSAASYPTRSFISLLCRRPHDTRSL